MFNLIQTFTHAMGFHLTPIDMKGVGLIFLPKELEDQLGYDDLSDMIRQSDSFAEGIEYLILRDSKLLELKELLRSRNTIPEPLKLINEVLKYSPTLIVLTEPGLYTVTFLSRKPQAQNFRRWVTGEVLPSIRKTGAYKLSHRAKAFESELTEKIHSLEKSWRINRNII